MSYEAGVASPIAAAGLYVHFPYCSAICPYCDFAVLKGEPVKRREYVALLLTEVERLEQREDRFETLYFGGGTPSLVPPEDLERVLAALKGTLDLSSLGSFTLEVNPEDIDQRRLGAWHELGVTRLSFGVQSFDEDRLRLLGRRHSPATALRAIALARSSDIPELSLDLIYCLPGESVDVLRSELDTAVGLQPDHLSCYQLTIHEGTPFERLRADGQIQVLADDPQAELFELVHSHLPANGYEAYEVSNFARSPSRRSLHNQKYWRHDPYLGLGLAAHSFDGRRRRWNHRSLEAYTRAIEQRHPPTAGGETLSRQDLALERLLLGLRTIEGVELALIVELLGESFLSANESWVRSCESRGWVRRHNGRLYATRAGWAIADTLAAGFELASPT